MTISCWPRAVPALPVTGTAGSGGNRGGIIGSGDARTLYDELRVKERAKARRRAAGQVSSQREVEKR